MANRKDPRNSSTAVLAADATFTGTPSTTEGTQKIVVNVLSNQASAADGVKIQFSNANGAAWRTDYTTSGSASGNVLLRLESDIFGAFYRVQYQNNVVGDQTSFSLTTFQTE